MIEGRLPALLTVELSLAAPRYASLPEMVRALRHTIKVWGAKDIEGLPELLGLKGSPTTVKEIFSPPARQGGSVFDTTQDKEKATTTILDAFFEKERQLLNEINVIEG